MPSGLPLVLALFFGLGHPGFDAETRCIDPRLAASAWCQLGPWAELLPGPAAVRARWLYVVALLHEANGEHQAADRARAAADEALELALTRRSFARSWLEGARAELASARAAQPQAGAHPPAIGVAGWDETPSPAKQREGLAAAREALR